MSLVVQTVRPVQCRVWIKRHLTEASKGAAHLYACPKTLKSCIIFVSLVLSLDLREDKNWLYSTLGVWP